MQRPTYQELELELKRMKEDKERDVKYASELATRVNEGDLGEQSAFWRLIGALGVNV